MEREYKYTWCDFLTPCPHKDCEVGSYECHTCENFVNATLLSDDISKADGYKRYVMINKGIVTCKINN